jgi:transposase-like protein
MVKTKTDAVLRDQIIACFGKYSGNVSAVSRELGCSRSTVRRNIAKVGIGKKPLAGGKQRAKHHKETLPESGTVKRYILTAAQNNTHVHDAFWANVLAMADHYDATILVGTFSYNQNNYGQLAVKSGTKKPAENTLWFDPRSNHSSATNALFSHPALSGVGI